MNKAALYIRVSTEEQARSGTSLASQRKRLTSYAAREGLKVSATFQDQCSGSLTSRPGLDALLRLAETGKLDLVLVTELDRLTRAEGGHLDSLLLRLAELGVALVAVDDGLNLATRLGRLTGRIKGVLASEERAVIRERTVRGRLDAAREGRFVSSTPPFGYRRQARAGGGFELVIDPVQAACIRDMYRVFIRGGLTGPQAAVELNALGHLSPSGIPWTSAALRRWARRAAPLRNASGTWTFDGVDVPIPAILSAAEASVWRAWQAVPVPEQRSRGPYLMSSFLRMPCGRGASGRTTDGRRPQYVCRNHYLMKDDPRRHHDCRGASVDWVDAAVLAVVREALHSPGLLDAAASAHIGVDRSPAKLVALFEERAQLEVQITQVVTGLAGAGATAATVTAATAPLIAQQKTLARRIAAEQRRLSDAASAPEMSELAARMKRASGTNDHAIWRRVFHALSVTVTITGYAQCSKCGGSGYTGLKPGKGRRGPPHCSQCLLGRVPVLTVEHDDVAAAVLALSIEQAG